MSDVDELSRALACGLRRAAGDGDLVKLVTATLKLKAEVLTAAVKAHNTESGGDEVVLWFERQLRELSESELAAVVDGAVQAAELQQPDAAGVLRRAVRKRRSGSRRVRGAARAAAAARRRSGPRWRRSSSSRPRCPRRWRQKPALAFPQRL